MKKISLIGMLILTFAFASNCEQFGVFGQSGIKGSEVKKRINDAATYNNIIIGALVSRAGFNVASALVFTILIDNVVVPSLAGVSDSKKYKVESVDDCVSKIKSSGLILSFIVGYGNWISATTCNLETSPSIIEIGPIELF